MPSIITRVTNALEATTKGSPLTNAEIDQNFININNQVTLNAELGKDLTGFPNRTDSTISFNESTRVLTLAPTDTSFTVYHRGVPYVINGAKTVTITDTHVGRYIIYDHVQNRLLDVGLTPSFSDQIVVAYIYWDAFENTAIIFGDERHTSARDTTWHNFQHNAVGALWKSGGTASYTINNANQVQVSLTAPIVVWDEDIEHSITHVDAGSINPSAQYQQTLSNGASLPILYLSGTVYKQAVASTLPWMESSTRGYYNPIVLDNGSLAVAPSNGLFITYWLVATNDIKFPIKLIMGRNAHATYGDAEGEDFDGYGLPMPEIAPMYKFILQTSDTYTQNTARVKIVGVKELVGKQNARSNSFDTFSHNALSDRNTANQHSISSITDLQTTLDAISGNSIAMSIALG
jgi:hypothetical protein